MSVVVVVVTLFVLSESLSHGFPLLSKNPTFKNPFIGFYVFPHGGIILDPEKQEYSSQPAFTATSKEKAIRLHQAAQVAAKQLIESRPDLIIFSTPHGFHLTNKNLILSTKSMYGTAGSIWDDFTAKFDIDTRLSSILYSELKSVDNHVEMLSLGVGQETMSLMWAEVIPWHFILEAASSSNFKIPPVIYIGQPSDVNISQLRHLGQDISKVALLRQEFQNRQIAVVVSGDLSHLHSSDPNAPYPYNPISNQFDQHILNWAKLDRNANTEKASETELLEKAGQIEDDSGHCGFTGLVMLHGMIEELVNQNWNYKSIFLSYDIPSYFGMMVTSWVNV